MRRRSVVEILIVLLAGATLGACNAEQPGDAEVACDTVEALVDTIRDLRQTPDGAAPVDPDAPGAAAQLADAYRTLAARYRDVAADLDVAPSVAHTRRIAAAVDRAADRVEELGYTDRDELIAALQGEPAIEEMADVVNDHLPLGLDALTTEHVVERCDPDLAGLTHPEPGTGGSWPDPVVPPDR